MASFQRKLQPLMWLTRHAQVALYSLGRMVRSAPSTLMTALVLGIAIALPVGLHLLADNLQSLSGHWQGASGISAFLKEDLPDRENEALLAKIRQFPTVGKLTYVSPADAMLEFRAISGFKEALDLLEENPLPPVLLIQPAQSADNQATMRQLVAQLSSLPEVELVQADLQWVQRFQAMTSLLERGATVLGIALGLAIILVMGNSIRLEIQGRQREIEIIKLVGGTDAFTRRPFLYEGAWFGLLGGLIACALVLLAFSLLAGSAAQLANLYGTDFRLEFLPLSGMALILAGSTALGLGGAWLAVALHLRALEPGKP